MRSSGRSPSRGASSTRPASRGTASSRPRRSASTWPSTSPPPSRRPTSPRSRSTASRAAASGTSGSWSSAMRVFVLCRHGESMLNVERRVNGDPNVPVALTERGREEAKRLGEQVAHLPLDACVHTRFPRSRETAEIVLAERDDVPLAVEPLLDDIDVGDLEGELLETYRAWKHGNARNVPFPGGESLDDAARRYAAAFGRLLDSPWQT